MDVKLTVRDNNTIRLLIWAVEVQMKESRQNYCRAERDKDISLMQFYLGTIVELEEVKTQLKNQLV